VGDVRVLRYRDAVIDMSKDSIVPISDGGISTALVDKVISSVDDANSAKNASTFFSDLEDALKKRRQYATYAKEFCKYEAQMYVKIAQIPNAESRLKPTEKKIVAWLRTKSGDEIDALIDECATGIRLNKLWDKECREQIRQERVNSECKRISRLIIDEAKMTGRTQLNRGRFYEEARGVKLDKETVSAYTEKTKNRLLEMNVRGLNDGEGTYIAPPFCERDELAEIIQCRIKGIESDLRFIRTTCEKQNYHLSSGAFHNIVALIDALKEVETH